MTGIDPVLIQLIQDVAELKAKVNIGVWILGVAGFSQVFGVFVTLSDSHKKAKALQDYLKGGNVT
jgi:hypothetical protein